MKSRFRLVEVLPPTICGGGAVKIDGKTIAIVLNRHGLIDARRLARMRRRAKLGKWTKLVARPYHDTMVWML